MFFDKAVYRTFISSIMIFFLFHISDRNALCFEIILPHQISGGGGGVYPLNPPPGFTPGNRSARIVRIPVDAVSSRCHEVTADQGTTTLIS